MCLWEFLRVTIGTCVFCADGIMITNNSNNDYVFFNVFMFRIMSMTLRNINPQKEIFHHYDFPVYTTSKYQDPKLDTYRRITHNLYWTWNQNFKNLMPTPSLSASPLAFHLTPIGVFTLNSRVQRSKIFNVFKSQTIALEITYWILRKLWNVGVNLIL